MKSAAAISVTYTLLERCGFEPAGWFDKDDFQAIYNLMRAWYFATALAKQPTAALPWLTEKRLDVWTHNKTIQKAVESRRITPEQKQALRALRVRSQKLCEERCV